MKQEILMSIDKLSFTAVAMHGVDSSSITDFLSVNGLHFDYWYSPKNFFYQHNFKMECGSIFQLGFKDNVYICRLEFNPNKANMKVIQKLIPKTKYPKLTRIDWAVDYKGYDFSKYEIHDLVGRKTVEYRSRSKRRESYYVGVPSSDNFIRIYDKAKEMKKRKSKGYSEEEVQVGDWWRVEAVIKDFDMEVEKEINDYIDCEGKTLKVTKKEKVTEQGYIFKNPFRCIEVYNYFEHGTENLKINEQAMLYFLEQFPHKWDELSKNSRKKYEGLKFECTRELIENQPYEIFDKEKTRLGNELVALLKPALDNGHYLIGDINNIQYSIDFLNKQSDKTTL